MSLTVRVLVGLVLGLLVGLLIAASGSPRLVALGAAVEPIGTVWVNGIRMTVIPLVVASIIVGVASLPDAHTIGRLGGRTLLLFVLGLAAAGVVAAILAPPLLALFPIDPDAAASLRAGTTEAGATAARTARELPGFIDWLVALVPANPFRAATDGAILPLIVFAVAFGLALTRIADEARAAIVRFFDAIAAAMIVLVRWVLWLAPVGVFALALPLAVQLGAAAAGAIAWYNAVVVIIIVIFVAGVLYPAAVFIGRAPLPRFARAALPAQAVAFSSRSSLASLPPMIEGGTTLLGFPAEVTGFFLPLSASVFRVGSIIVLTIGSLFIAQLYGVSISAAQLAAIVVTSGLTSFSVPSVPSATILVGVPVLLAAGLPVEGVGVLLAVDTIPDMFRTTANVTAHMAAGTILARGEPAAAASIGARDGVVAGDQAIGTRTTPPATRATGDS